MGGEYAFRISGEETCLVTLNHYQVTKGSQNKFTRESFKVSFPQQQINDHSKSMLTIRSLISDSNTKKISLEKVEEEPSHGNC